MYCKICGASLTPNETFCKNCGASTTDSKSLNSNIEVQSAVPFQPNDVIIEEEPPSFDQNKPVLEKQETKSKETKTDDKFLVIIGVVVGILSFLVIAYLIYSSLQEKNTNNNQTVTIIPQNNHNVIFADYNFSLSYNVTVSANDYLEFRKSNWVARLYYNKDLEFNSIKLEDVQRSFANITDYTVDEVSLKNYNELSCFEAEVDYHDETKTVLLLCERKAGGYWLTEIGSIPYTSYPTSDDINEFTRILATSTKVESAENKLGVGNVEIQVEKEILADEENLTSE